MAAACRMSGRAVGVVALALLLVAAVALPVRKLDEAAGTGSDVASSEEEFTAVRQEHRGSATTSAPSQGRRGHGRHHLSRNNQQASPTSSAPPESTATTGSTMDNSSAAPPSDAAMSPTDAPVGAPTPSANGSTTRPENASPLPTTEATPMTTPATSANSTEIPSATIAPNATVAPNASNDANASRTDAPTAPSATTAPEPAATLMPATAPSLGTGSGPRKPSWKDHPVYRAHPKEVKPPILAWFTTRNFEETPWTLLAAGTYVQQSCELKLLNKKYKNTSEENMLRKYDTLTVGKWGSTTLDNFLEFETTRDSQMCLVFGVDDPRFRGEDIEMSVPAGYKALGLAKGPENATWPEIHKFASYDGKPISWGYVACRTLTAGVHKLPTKENIGAGFKLWGYNVLFSEVDGSAPPLPVKPPGWSGPEIVAHRNCPKELHDMWRVENHDPADPYTRGMTWQTWHPQRDYLYNCYYGHEHGSPGVLVGYTERFHYTAFKNNHQNETHEGFKGYVVPLPDYNMYMNIHSNTKFMGRMDTQNHTVVIAILDKSGNLKFEMSCKCNFGGSAADYAVRPKEGIPFLPMGNPATQKLITDMFAPSIDYKDRKVHKKRINLYNPTNLDPKLRYEKNDAGHGVYEGWVGGGDQYCLKAGAPYAGNGFEVDIKNPHTGCRDQACTIPITLGNKPNQYTDFFRPNMGLTRVLRFKNLSIAPEHCGFKPKTNDGVFYTDQYCSGLQSGPGPNAVKQFMHSDFKGVWLNNIYDISDVHGHEFYRISHPGGPDDFNEASVVKGLHGFAQDQGALSYDVTEPTY